MARSFFSRKSSREERDSQVPVEESSAKSELPAAASKGPEEDATETAQTDDEPETTTVASEPDASAGTVEEEQLFDLMESVQHWRSELVAAARADGQQAKASAVSLLSAHPGGLASLYAGSPTRLSTLIREPEAFRQAAEGLGRLVVFATKLRDQHGAVTLHLSIGSASWGGPRPALEAPMLMRRVTVREDEDGEFILELLPGVEVSGRLLKEAELAGAVLDQVALASALDGSESFSPTIALDQLRSVGELLPEFQYSESLSVGVLTHPTNLLFRELSDLEWLNGSPIVRALAGDRSVQFPAAQTESGSAEVDRDPWQEVGVGDQSPQVQNCIETLASGATTLVEPEPGADCVGAAVSLAAALAQEGSRVLVVSADPILERQISDRFSDLGIDRIVADLFVSEDVAALRLEAAMKDTSSSAEVASLEEMRTSLRRVRQSLQAYEEKLHEEFYDWGVTPFSALQVLTELTSDPDGPTTRVRMDSSTLSKLAEDGGQHARDLLEKASVQGLLSGDAAFSPWADIALRDSAEAETALSAVEGLAKVSMPAVRVQMARVSGQTGLRNASTIAGWSAQLSLISEAASVLDRFRPEAFDRSPADFVAATGLPQWRKERGINLKSSKRRQLVRQARDLVRPGLHVEDLHAALIEVQNVRSRWIAASVEGEPWPVIPEGLDQCLQTLDQAQDELNQVAPYLQDAFGDLRTMPLDELCPVLEALADDPNGARLRPAQLILLTELEDLGLSELVADFQARHVDGELIGLELDLSWWASALGLMLAAEPSLGGFDPEVLQGYLNQFRALDKQQVLSLGPALVDRVKARRKEALALYPEQYTGLVSALAEGQQVAPLFGSYSLAWDMLPVVCIGPAVAPLVSTRRHRVDAVIAVGTGSVSTAEMAPVLAQAKATVAFVSPGEEASTGWLAEARKILPVVSLPAELEPATGPIANLVVARIPDSSLVCAPSPQSGHSIELLRASGSGMPAPGAVAVESSLGEAEAVAAFFKELVTSEPEGHPVVVTFNDVHADRLRSTVRRMTISDPGFAQRVEQLGGVSSVVVKPEALPRLHADHTIISVGFTKTPHGRVIHDFGVLSSAGGGAVMEALAQGAAGKVTVATTLSAADIDTSRIRQPGAQILVDLIAAAEGETSLVGQTAATESAPYELLVDLADRLHSRGLSVVPNLGTGSLRIPLAVGHPEVPGELLVAVLTDDPTYLEQKSLRLRDRRRLEQLEALGWKVRTELSMAVFIDPDGEAQKIIDLALDAVDEHYVRVGNPATPVAAQRLGSLGDPRDLDEPLDSSSDFLVEDDYDAVYVSTETGMIDLQRTNANQTDEVSVEVPAKSGSVSAQLGAKGSGGEDAVLVEDSALEPETTEAAEEPELVEVLELGEFDGALDGSEDEALLGEVTPEASDADEELWVTVSTTEPEIPEGKSNSADFGFTEDSAETADFQADEVVPEALQEEPAGAPRDSGEAGPRPQIVSGLPLAAYSDDQLDEVAQWVWANNPGGSTEEIADELRSIIGIKRRGAQSDAVLLNVVERTSE